MLLEAVRNDKDYYLKAAFNSLEIGPPNWNYCNTFSIIGRGQGRFEK